MHHTFLYISLLLCRYCDMKMPYFAFYGEHKLATIFISLSELGYGPLEFDSLRGFASIFDKGSG